MTGNSAHYALTSDGRPLDVLPGLYGPKRFLIWLGTMHALYSNLRADKQADLDAMLKWHHQNRRDALLERWELDIQRLGERQVNSSPRGLIKQSRGRARPGKT